MAFHISAHKKRGYENIIHFWQHDKKQLQVLPDTAKSSHAIKSRLYSHLSTSLFGVMRHVKLFPRHKGF